MTQALDRIRLHANSIADIADRRTTAVDGLSIDKLMRSMVDREGEVGWMGDVSARDEWEQSDATAKLLPADLRPRFASGGRRDCALVSWDWLRASKRALSSGVAAKGGYMVGVDTLAEVDPLWQDSITAVAGVQRLEGMTSNAAIPRGTAGVTTSWQSADGVSVAAVDAVLGTDSATPKTVYATVQCTVQQVRQSDAFAGFLSRLLIRSAIAAIDTAFMQGTGGTQPMGLSNLPTASGLQQVSGGSLALAGVLSAQRLASVAGVPDSRMVWIGAPTVRETLGARERVATSGRFLWEDNRIVGMPALATPDAPAATLFVGDFSQALLVTFGPGIEIRYDPHNNFNAGLVAFQVLVMVDIVFMQPAAFVRIASIT